MIRVDYETVKALANKKLGALQFPAQPAGSGTPQSQTPLLNESGLELKRPRKNFKPDPLQTGP